MLTLKKYSIAVSSILSVLLFTGSFANEAHAKEPITEVKKLVENYYYPNITTEDLKNATTIKALMSKLDKYSAYMTNEEMTSFLNDIEMTLVGIGVTIEPHKKGIKIVEVVKDAPAAKSGIKAGHIITKIEGQAITSKTLEEVSNLLRGAVDTYVNVTVLDSKTGKETTKKIKRKKIVLKNVEAKRLAGGVGYIRLNSFSTNSAADIQKEMKKLKNISRWIFDLRGNGGGSVEAATKVIGLFKGAQFAYFEKYAHDTTYYYQTPIKQKTQFNGPVALLVDKNSASASEMTAAALKGQKLATLYGQTTYGKGVQQGIYELSGKKGFIKLTIAEFYGPSLTTNLVKINKVGVKPNVKTAVGNELIISHRELLKKTLAKNVKLDNMKVAYAKQEITVKPSQKIAWSQLKTSKIHLMQLGGVTRKINIKKLSSKQLKITAPSGLKKGTKYYMKINPTKGKTVYAYVTVSSK